MNLDDIVLRDLILQGFECTFPSKNSCFFEFDKVTEHGTSIFGRYTEEDKVFDVSIVVDIKNDKNQSIFSFSLTNLSFKSIEVLYCLERKILVLERSFFDLTSFSGITSLNEIENQQHWEHCIRKLENEFPSKEMENALSIAIDSKINSAKWFCPLLKKNCNFTCKK